MGFPNIRLRRLRNNEVLRTMVQETWLSVNDFIYPLFITHGQDKKIPVPSMPGVFQFSTDQLLTEVKTINSWSIPAVILFGIPDYKDAQGSSGHQADGVVQQGIKIIKDQFPELLVITDVCLCEYTDHGHCGIPLADGTIDNDKTLELLAQQALSHAKAGCDMVAPSDMMDGRIGYIRRALDENGYNRLPIMSYAAKYCSSFYGPFREAADSAPQFGDRKTYQMNPANALEAIREVALDIEEGADIVMVKPALPYLDIIRKIKDQFGYPTAAYNVSGEYAMVKAAASLGWLDEEKALLEMTTSIKRAGADLIITYAAKELARLLVAEG
ncbi:MAG: porphobilinogen synthase [Syntrophomonadaceae bacterium]|jgi:porphobilinogen synthase